MGLVRTQEEIASIQATLSAPRFTSAEMLSVEFLTRPEIVGRLLPPPLVPADEPLVSAMVGRWQSNCVGDYDGGAIYVSASHEGVEAAYVLAMYMSTDQAIIFGRDVFGEPKKQSTSGLNRAGSRMTGWIHRGVRLIDIEADLTTDNGPVETSGANFNFKAQPASDGSGLEDDAILTFAEFDMSLTTSLSGTGTVRLGGTIHDPLDEIEVVEVRQATYIEGTLAARCRSIARTPADEFLPFAYGRLDYWPALDTTGGQRTDPAAVALT
jgi:acetoacetate decarboxylase